MHSRALTRGESQHRPVNEEKQKELRDRPSNNLYVQDHSQSMIPSRPMQTYDSIQPGYYLPSYIEDGDPMENDSKLKSSFTSAVGYNGYGRVPVALYLNPSNFAGHQVTEPTTPLTPSYDSQCDWWDDVPNKEVSVLRQLRLTTSEFTPTKTEYDTYILHRNKQYATTKELPGASSSHAERGDGMVAAPVSANVRDTYALATPSRQTFGGLPVMNPSRNWNTHSPSRIRAVSSRSNLGTSQTSQLGSIPETQHSPTRGLGDSFRVSPLFERRGAGLPYVMADRFVSHQTLRRSVSEVLQRHVMPQSPYLYRVVEPAIPFTTNEPGENSQQHNPLQDCPEESFPPTSENLRLFVSHASAFSTGKRAVLTMPSGFPCAGFPVFSLGTAPALGTRHDGQPISGLPIAALDLCQASGTGCTRSLCFAVKVNPLYSVAKESGSCQILHSATLNFLGNQYPYADVEESRPSSHVEIKNTEPLTLFKGSLEELRLMYSTELRCMMSQQIRSGSRETPSDASNSKSGSTKRASSPVQLPVFIEASRSYGMSTLSIAASRKVGNQKEIHQSQQRLSPNFKQQLESSKRLSEIAIPNHPHSILKSNLPPHGAGRQQMIKDDPSLKVLAEEGLVPVSPFIGASEVVSAPTHELAPTWVQSEHPRSWRSRLAMGESITPFTANAFNLLTSLDPAKYCLPYGVSCRMINGRCR